MSLVKKPTMTGKKAAANQRNARQSRGPATPQGKKRSAAAHLVHGLDVKAPDYLLPTLGEDPAEFEDLRQRLYDEFTPAGALQEKLVNRLARVLWLIDRTDRSLEGEALRRARTADGARDNRLHARMMRLKMTVETLRSLARSVAEWHYVTPREDLDVMKKLRQEGVAGEMGEIALDIFFQLQDPGTDKDGVTEEEHYRGAVNSFRSIFGLEEIKEPVSMLSATGERIVLRPEGYVDPDAPADDDEGRNSEKDDRYPKITEEDWIARERARKLLKNILTRQAEACEAQRRLLLKESLAGPSPYELAAEIAPSPAEALLLRRMQDANMREVRRLTNMLLKIKRQPSQIGGLRTANEAVVCHDMLEKEAT